MADTQEIPLVTPEVLSEWIGEPITETEDIKRAARVLRYAFTLVNTETGRDTDYWRSEGLPEDVANVVLQVAGRGYLNPESWGNEGTDDWRGGGRPVEELGMYLTPTEKRTLGRFSTRISIGFGTVQTYRGDMAFRDDRPWFDPSTGGINDWGI